MNFDKILFCILVFLNAGDNNNFRVGGIVQYEQPKIFK